MIALCAKRHRPEHPITGPVFLQITHTLPRPKSHFGTGKKASMLKDSAPTRHAAKPDVDNLAKAAMDALTTLGFWADDDQISILRVIKNYGERPGAFFQIREISPKPLNQM